jgi:hypothetical protein
VLTLAIISTNTVNLNNKLYFCFVLFCPGGVALTVCTGGIGAVVAGGVIIGAGSSMITNPIAKQITGETMNAKDLVLLLRF